MVCDPFTFLSAAVVVLVIDGMAVLVFPVAGGYLLVCRRFLGCCRWPGIGNAGTGMLCSPVLLDVATLGVSLSSAMQQVHGRLVQPNPESKLK